MIGANWDPKTSRWDIFDYSGGTVTVKPWAYGDGAGIAMASAEGGGIAAYRAAPEAEPEPRIGDYNAEGQRWCGPEYGWLTPYPEITVEDVRNNEGAQNMIKYGCITTDDLRPGPPPLIPLHEVGQTSYDYSQHFTVNGMKLGTDMMQRPISDIFKLFPLYMGT